MSPPPSPSPPTKPTIISTAPTAILSFDPESPQDWSHFLSIPWCATLLSRPGLRPYTADLPTPGRTSDPVVGGILARGGSGVLNHVSLLDLESSGGGGHGERPQFPQHIDLYTLGPALAGVPLPVPVLHGGVACLLVDAAAGRVGYMHRFCARAQPEGGGALVGAYSKHTDTRFRRPALMDGPGGTLTLVDASTVI
ncbi:hypothetical protein F4810DRAFT_708931 [Camillea tinctor]|nr:hypothetical protein F4810DRAFT_708931 [Camillea tinctor]